MHHESSQTQIKTCLKNQFWNISGLPGISKYTSKSQPLSPKPFMDEPKIWVETVDADLDANILSKVSQIRFLVNTFSSPKHIISRNTFICWPIALSTASEG